MTKTKRELTLEWCKHLNKSVDVDAMYRLIWRNTNPDKGLQLTDAGAKFIITNNIKHWKVELVQDSNLSSRDIILLDRYMSCPYFLTRGQKKSIILLDDFESFTLQMYGCDLKHYLASNISD